MSNAKRPTCEYEVDAEDVGHGESGPKVKVTRCGAPAAWSSDIGGGCSYFCDHHKRLCEEGEEAQLDANDPRRVPFHRLLEIKAGEPDALKQPLQAEHVAAKVGKKPRRMNMIVLHDENLFGRTGAEPFFRPVAQVIAIVGNMPGDINVGLERAFDVTNTGDVVWHTEKAARRVRNTYGSDVVCLPLSKVARSTSVGDRIYDAVSGRTWEVATTGFEEVTPDDQTVWNEGGLR